MCLQNVDWRTPVGQTIDETLILGWISEKYEVSIELLNCQTFLPFTCHPLCGGYLITLSLLGLPTNRRHIPKSGTYQSSVFKHVI
jgi:hypothetical protein